MSVERGGEARQDVVLGAADHRHPLPLRERRHDVVARLVARGDHEVLDVQVPEAAEQQGQRRHAGEVGDDLAWEPRGPHAGLHDAGGAHPAAARMASVNRNECRAVSASTGGGVPCSTKARNASASSS